MRHRRLAVVTAVVAVLVAGGGVAYAQTQGTSGSYRTATVAVADVDETLGLSGTITASARQDLSFGAAGTVKKVDVAAGDTVAAGDVLATLDDTDLKTAVTKAEATLAKATAQLETDRTSQASTVTESETPSTSTPSTSTPSSGTSSSKDSTDSKDSTKSDDTASRTATALKAALKKLAAQQTAVTTAQTAATDAITAAKTSLAAQVEACKVPEQAPADDSSDDDSSDDASDGEDTDDSSDEVPAAGISDACTKALDDVQAAQDVVSQKQDVLQKALQDLSTTLTAAVKTVGESGSSGSGTSTPSSDSSGSTGSTEEPAAGESTPSTSSGSTGSGSTSSGSGASGDGSGAGTVTAATLAQDQAAIDTADAELTEAERALTSARLTAPFAGEILSVSAAKGDVVADGDVVIVIAGDGATTVTTTVTLDQVDEVAVGQTASVTPAGSAEPVTGTVTSIGLLPDTSTDTSTYPVTLDLDGEVAAPEGSTASIQLVIGTAEGALTVPSSAVSTIGRTTVTVLEDGRTQVTPVTVGVVGATRTAITDGLTKGQEVVLADLDAALPSGDATTTSLTGGGGFPGGGQRAGRG